ncbi:RNA-binding domain-containing protein [Leifsonia sp. C5G2]|uniref:RNA-binding domain-containing protein n=1 Tax=Leifsonia sp. C5G2 TaxID=2735269 RepID=UPI0015845F7E|nr:RNA-binding domain-containing protein [Leifsonia sp. C5G2]NUU06294.1 transcriptional regulator [Leifsonia sp. C5G2]
MRLDDVAAIVRRLRSDGSDHSSVEAKRAAGGLPSNIASTISAFANTDGGLIILGLDENTGFKTTGIADAAAMQQSVANATRTMSPPPHVEVSDVEFEKKKIVLVEVRKLDANLRPSRTSDGKAYVRVYDGDYPMSVVEEQTFITNRGRPRFDSEPVPEATREDLDDSYVRRYLQLCRRNPQLARFTDDGDLLERTSVLARSGTPTVAGILAMGVYPQQFFPRLVIKASVAADPSSNAGTRATDVREISGPIPAMLDEALEWVIRNTRTRVAFGEDGHGRDVPEYPTVAVRELLSNALIHRDLAPHTLGQSIVLRLERDKLIVTNPGGLWDLDIASLGLAKVSSPRNERLASILQNVRTLNDERVVELLASGIPTILTALAEAGMEPPKFYNETIRFTARVPNHALMHANDIEWLATLPGAHGLSDKQRVVLAKMRGGMKYTNATLREEMTLDSRDARKLLTNLVSRGLARAVGINKGRIYEMADDREPAVSAPAHPTVAPITRMRPEDAADQVAELLRTAGRPLRTRDVVAEFNWRDARALRALNAVVARGDAVVIGSGRGPGTAYQWVGPGQ